MESRDPSVRQIDQNEIISFIRLAKQRLMFMAPGMSEEVAIALADKWRTLDKNAVDIILDLDPEVCRLGYGDFKAIRLLHDTSKALGSVEVRHQPGLRICLLVADDKTLIFSPTPLLIEGGSKVNSHFNAILLATLPDQVALDVGLEKGSASEKVIGNERASAQKIKDLQNNLAFNPPVKFDVAQKVRVFNARFEFVDFEVRGCAISRRTVKIPSRLMGLAKDEKTQKLLRSTYQLIDPESSLSGDNVFKLKQAIVKKYLVLIPGYGYVVLRGNKDKFVYRVKCLEKYIQRFRLRAEKALQAEIDTNREALVKALAPALEKNTPVEWRKFFGWERQPTSSEASDMLSVELTRIFGSAQGMLSSMEVTVLFKGITYESLVDEKFLVSARKAMPFLDVFHDEYDAAKASVKA